MTNNENNEIIRIAENDLIELESMIAEPNGIFSISETTRMFKNHTSIARANAIVPLYKAVKEVAEEIKGLEILEKDFPHNSHVIDIKRRYARCGQHLISIINMIEEWGI
jgi:hypothetical protein